MMDDLDGKSDGPVDFYESFVLHPASIIYFIVVKTTKRKTARIHIHNTQQQQQKERPREQTKQQQQKQMASHRLFTARPE